MKFGSLFSGIGGLDLGLERAGMECLWQSEIDEHASLVLGEHWPAIPNLGDITQIDWTTVERPNLICGGHPCQPFSNAGRRRGSDDTKHLWPYFANALRVLRPPLALLENVPGHLSLGFDAVLADLASLGYDAEWSTVSACAMGAPHTRERLFVVAYTKSVRFRGGWFNNAPWSSGEPKGPGETSYWATVPTPSTLGMAHGTPTRMDRDRLKEHGNAVVPQVVEWVGRRIMEAINDMSVVCSV